MDIPAGIAATANAYSLAKALRGVEKNYDLAELKAKMADIMTDLADVKMAFLDAQQKLAERDAEIARLKAVEIDRSALIEAAGGYKYRAVDEKPVGFPCCPRCDSTDDKLITLVQEGHVEGAKCPVCATAYNPVTCYLPQGGTLAQQFYDERRRKNAEVSARMNAHNRSAWAV